MKPHLLLHHSRLFQTLKFAGRTYRSTFVAATYIEDYRVLGLKNDSNQDEVRAAFVKLAKIYHPDSGSKTRDAEKFREVEASYRRLQEKFSKERAEMFSAERTNEVFIKNAEGEEEEECDIEHTAPQHRQYLSFEGRGFGSMYQREKQHRIRKAEKATEGVFMHRMRQSGMIDESSLIAVESKEAKKIKTRYGMDRLVEDLIRESMERGEFSNIKGTGKPLKERTAYPYVDEVTRKINEILIDNGFSPQWVTLQKEIRQEIDNIRTRLEMKRQEFGNTPLSSEEVEKWGKFLTLLEEDVEKLNRKINNYNLVVPSLHKQMLHFQLKKIAEKVLLSGKTKFEVRKDDMNLERDENEERWLKLDDADEKTRLRAENSSNFQLVFTLRKKLPKALKKKNARNSASSKQALRLRFESSK